MITHTVNWGYGADQNYPEAAKWYRKSAQQGYIMAQLELAEMYYDGEGVPQDFAEAAKWLGLAAEKGNSQAQWELCLLYEKGEGVPQSNIVAQMWCNLSGAQGHPFGSTERDAIAAKMTPAQIAEAQRLAREWKPK